MMNSLRIKLSLYLALAILGVALLAGLWALFSAYNEAHELQDDMLRQIASLSERHDSNTMPTGQPGPDADSDPEARIYTQLLSTQSPHASPAGSAAPLALPAKLNEGLQTVQAGDKTYRVLVRSTSAGAQLAVAQETAMRDEAARDSALRTLMPLLLLIPILLLIVTQIVRTVVTPVADLSREMDQRAEQDLAPIRADALPAEIRPFIAATNRLLRRLQQSIDEKQRFIADAAHELRSPLTALSLQAERLNAAEMSADARRKLVALRHGIERNVKLINQLLSLARARMPVTAATETVSVRQTYRDVLEDLMPLAEEKSIDIGVVGEADASLAVDAFDLFTAVRNLVDNAIRYTPANGRIDLSVVAREGAVELSVEDSGPGIAPDLHARVFDPFFRGAANGEIGSGLGLSIVRAICIRMGASVHLAHAGGIPESGLRVTLRFAAAG